MLKSINLWIYKSLYVLVIGDIKCYGYFCANVVYMNHDQLEFLILKIKTDTIYSIIRTTVQ